jgi:hypothetical protein
MVPPWLLAITQTLRPRKVPWDALFLRNGGFRFSRPFRSITANVGLWFVVCGRRQLRNNNLNLRFSAVVDWARAMALAGWIVR